MTEYERTEGAQDEGIVAEEQAPSQRHPFDRVLNFTENLSGLLIWAMAIGISLNVLLRSTLNIEIAWLFEVTEYTLLVVAFLGAAALLRGRGHVSVDLVGELVLVSSKRTIIRIGDVIGAVILGGLAVASAMVTYDAFLAGNVTTGVVQIPRWWIFAVLPTGFALMSVQSFRNCLGDPERLAPTDDLTTL